MRRSLVFLSVLCCLAGFTYAMIRNSPLLRSVFPEKDKTSTQDSLRRARYYRLTLRSNVDSICVVKHLRELYVYKKRHLLKIYRVALGDAPVGHKHFEGDEKTPEGLYFIDGKNPFSSCHKNLGVSYPNASDRAFAKSQGKLAGGDIKIHGLPNGQGYVGPAHLLDDWTNGCIGITDQEIDELYRYVKVGVPILILK